MYNYRRQIYFHFKVTFQVLKMCKLPLTFSLIFEVGRMKKGDSCIFILDTFFITTGPKIRQCSI